MTMYAIDPSHPPASHKFLQGRTAMITGGSSGIGRAIALALASAGADIAIGSRRAVSRACRPALEAQGVRSIIVDVDVRSMDSIRQFHAAAVEALGPVDVLVNSAGVCHEQLLCGHGDDTWLESIEVNLNSVYRTIKLCLPEMIAREWGRIINIASDIALVGMAEYPAYCASKAAAAVLTRCAALEGASHGVCCNTISPGWVATEMAQRALATAGATGASAGYFTGASHQKAACRMLQPEEVAALASFLCRDEAAAITMQDITVSGAPLWYREARRMS